MGRTPEGNRRGVGPGYGEERASGKKVFAEFKRICQEVVK